MTFVDDVSPQPERGRWRPILIGAGKFVLGIAALVLVLVSALPGAAADLRSRL
jgi:hypothetical protein